MSIPHVIALIKRAAVAWDDDDAASMGAALAYYALFAIVPLLVVLIAVGGLVFGHDAAQSHILGQLRGLIGDVGILAIRQLVRTVRTSTTGVVAAVLGGAVLLLAATSAFSELCGDLDKIWRHPSTHKASGLVHFIRTRLISFGLICGIGVLLLVSLVASEALAAAGDWWGSRSMVWSTVVRAVNVVVEFGTITVAFAMIYKFLPGATVAWRDVGIGAVMTALLFEMGQLLIGHYLGRTGLAAGLGAAGSLVAFLVWLYYSAQVFLFGAELTWVYAYHHGSRAGQAPPDPLPPRRGWPVTAAAHERQIKKK